MTNQRHKVDLALLNPEQREAVEHFDGPMLILAGAGTGKTRVITFRMAWMLERGIPGSAIAAMTFTNKAAREMAERIAHVAGPGHQRQLKDLSVSTFHSFCLKILRQHAETAGVSPRFGIVDTGDQLDLVTRALKEKNWMGTVQVEELHAAISRWKNDLLGPEEVLSGKGQLAGGYDREMFARVYDLYERQLKINRVIDFDDCIFKSWRLLREHPEVQKSLAARYRYILVDEFQDTNFAQLSVLGMIGRHHNNVCVVGDDDQSIYSWRGAMYETLDEFERMFPGTKLVKLEQNYRCSNVILDAANSLIRNNSKRKDKSLWSDSPTRIPIRLVPLDGAESEARWIAEQAMSLLGGGARLKDMAVLYRANAQSRPVEMALREAGLRAKVFGGTGFFERKEVKDFIAFLKLVVDPDDRLAFWRAISACPSGVGIKTLERVSSLAEQGNTSPFRAAESATAAELGRIAGAVTEFTQKIRALSSLAHNASASSVAQFGEEIIASFKLIDEILLNTKDAQARLRKIEILKSLPGWISNAARSVTNAAGKSLDDPLDWREVLDRITLSGEDDRTRGEDESGPEDSVSLMTMHAAKGLEFPIVFVVGLEEELLPHKNSINLGEPGIAEERRLFYVALTRAKERLFLSYALDRSSRMGSSQRKPSRFLKEIPANLLAGEDGEAGSLEGITDGAAIAKMREELRRKETIAKLGSLRSALFPGR
ncbi:MAG: ATP-dependent helicase [Pseudomonadota bacterium]|jgi:DNA helicase-2/ATP-dependent DNA helicase PcrA